MKTNCIKRAAAWVAAALLVLPLAVGAQQDATLVAEGAQVYSATCGRCHNARPGAERTDQEWVVIVAHMRARANMTRTQSDAVLAFLQATNTPETAVAAPPQVPHGPSVPEDPPQKSSPDTGGSGQ